MKERGHLGDTRVDGRIILNSSRLGPGAEADSCSHSTQYTKILCYSTEPSGYKKNSKKILSG